MSGDHATSSSSLPDRQKWIAGAVIANGSVLVDDLAARFGVSRMTIHRDLDALEQQRVLRKVRSGATAQPANNFESDVRYRLSLQAEAKEMLAEAALSHLESVHSICIDDATTLIPLARRLPSNRGLTVMTNFMPIVRELTDKEGIQLLVLGGEYQSRFDTLTGLVCERSVANLRSDLFVTSTTAVSDAVAYHPDPDIVRVKRAMMQSASKTILLVDSSKFQKTALHHVASLTEFDLVIVDAGISPEQVDACRDIGAQIEIAPRKKTAEEKGSHEAVDE